MEFQDDAALLRYQDSSSKETFDSNDDISYNEPNNLAQRRRWPWPLSVPFFVHSGVLLLYTVIFILANLYVSPFRSCPAHRPFERVDSHLSPIDDALQYEVRTVDYNFDHVSEFKGGKVADIDKEWLGVLNNPHEVRVSESAMEHFNLTSIQLVDGSNEYLASPISYHLLYCLYNIYKYNHPEFNGEEPAGPEWKVIHSDHCIDNIREFVQCHAGTGLTTYKWLPNRKIPWPELSTREFCVNWNAYDGWVQDHSVKMEDLADLKGGHLLAHPTLGPLTYDDYHEKDGSYKHKQHENHGDEAMER